MSDAATRRMIAAYNQEATAPMFLSGYFHSPPENFHRSEEIELDILRDQEDVAIAVTDLRDSGHSNEDTLYTNKSFKPPIYKEEAAISGFDMIKRQYGQNTFADPNYQAAAIAQSFRQFRKIERKIRRAIELQASQVLQTGKVTLRNKAGVPLYELDYKPKPTHFPTVATDWGTAGATPLSDVSALGDTIRRDGQAIPTGLLFGIAAFENFIDDPKVKERLDNRRMNLAEVAPQSRGLGATFQGWFWSGHYRYEMWTYDGFFKDPQTGAPTTYLDKNSVVMQSSGARLDLTFGAIPRLTSPDSRALPFLPSRLTNGDGGMDLTTNAWVEPNGESLVVSAGTRALCIPTAIDSFGCLKTVSA